LFLLIFQKIFSSVYPRLPRPPHNPLTALAEDLVRTGDQERAAAPGWPSSVGGWVMNP
jgi:hypothetical protein